MISSHWKWAAFLVVLGWARLGGAEEIESEVVEVNGATAKIRAAEPLPNIGDAVEISFGVSGLKDKAPFASGKVSEVNRQFISVAIEKSKAKVVPGLTARVHCTSDRLILCTLKQKGRTRLLLVRDDGLEVKTLMERESRETYATWSPDGKHIVFTTNDNEGQGLFVIDANGESMRRLTRRIDGGAAWSPDGKSIAFTRYTQEGGILLSTSTDQNAARKADADADVQADGSKAILPSADRSEYDADLAFSPDGKRIVFASVRTGTFRLYTMDPDGKNIRPLTQINNPGGNSYPAWEPNGKRIAFTNSAPGGTRQIFIIDADGKNIKQLTKDGDFNCYVSWSPDGKRLAYMSFAKRGSKGSLATMNPDGSEQKIIGRDQGAGHDGRTAWKPK